MGAVIGTGPELAYLTGSWASSHERLTALVIPARGEVKLLAPMTDAAELAQLDTILGLAVRTWRDGDDPYRMIGRFLRSGTIALGSSLTADHVFKLQAELETTVPASSALAELFMVKDADEIAQLERAAAAIDRVHAQVPELLRPGRTETKVAGDIDALIRAEHDSVDFVIVGSGPNGANPHHDYSERELEPGDPVVVDIGGSLGGGYHSDCTRTYVVGGSGQHAGGRDFREAYSVLKAAQEAARNSARPGMTAGELDAVARGPINRAGYGAYFTHRLGHGIGLGLHEEPFIIAGSDVVLEEGMTFSIEPGIYVPGRWGMRIEDIVVLEANGTRSLNRAPRELL